jgi:putative addiction module killer protein
MIIGYNRCQQVKKGARSLTFCLIYNTKIIVLLCGGDKFTQRKDIKRAKELAKEI